MIKTADIVDSCSVELLRNVDDLFLQTKKSSDILNGLVTTVANSLMLLGNFKVYKMSGLSDADGELMQSKKLITNKLLLNKDSGAVIISDDEKISVLVNEDDHLKLKCKLSGFALDNAFFGVKEVDEELSSKLNMAYDDKFGFLTKNLKDVGTGMRAVVKMFLPALTLLSEIDNIMLALKAKGVLITGDYNDSYTYYVSNNFTIGLSEREIISLVSSAVERLVELELSARHKLKTEELDMVMDLSWRAYGILSSCYSIDYCEFLKLAGDVKLGITLGLIVLTDNGYVDKLVEFLTDYSIIKFAGRNLTEDEISKIRAENLRTKLKNFRIK